METGIELAIFLHELSFCSLNAAYLKSVVVMYNTCQPVLLHVDVTICLGGITFGFSIFGF